MTSDPSAHAPDVSSSTGRGAAARNFHLRAVRCETNRQAAACLWDFQINLKMSELDPACRSERRPKPRSTDSLR